MAVRNASADTVDDVPQLNAHRNFNQAGVGDLAGQSEDLGSLALFRTLSSEPLRTVTDEGRHVGKGFDVVDERRFAPETGDCRIGRSRLRSSATSLNGGDQGSLFSADKSACTQANVDIEVERSSADVAAQQTTTTGVANRSRQTADCQRIFCTNVNVTFAGTNCVSSDGHAFDHP